MKPYRSKRENFQNAVIRLAESVSEHRQNPTDTVRDGVIQRFEFTFELSWKALREYMQEQGSTAELQFPRQILREAYAAGLINNEDLWLSMLSDRNTTSHIYDDRLAARIAQDIASSYLSELQTLAASLSK